ncbi:MAG: hypothetical protein EYC62_07335 [Alphaproteobacteria bacterium]|nr:MAG: hypothetical protein EYC62_07335 [Alphaproteobacteria bacterium]
MAIKLRGLLAGLAVAVGGATAPAMAQQDAAPQQPAVVTTVVDNDNAPKFNGEDQAYIGFTADGQALGYVGGNIGTFNVTADALAKEMAQGKQGDNGFFAVDSDNGNNSFDVGFQVLSGQAAVDAAASLKQVDPANIYTFEFVQGKTIAGTSMVEGVGLTRPFANSSAAESAANELSKATARVALAEQAKLAAANPAVTTTNTAPVAATSPVENNNVATQPAATTSVSTPEQVARMMGWKPANETGATQAAANTVVADANNNAAANTAVASNPTSTPSVATSVVEVNSATVLHVEQGDAGFLLMPAQGNPLVIFPASKQVVEVTVNKAALAEQFAQNANNQASAYFPQGSFGNSNAMSYRLLSGAEANTVLQSASQVLTGALQQVDNPEAIAEAKTGDGFTQSDDKGDGFLYTLEVVKVDGTPNTIEVNNLVLSGDNTHGGKGDINAFITALKGAQTSVTTIAQVNQSHMTASSVVAAMTPTATPAPATAPVSVPAAANADSVNDPAVDTGVSTISPEAMNALSNVSASNAATPSAVTETISVPSVNTATSNSNTVPGATVTASSDINPDMLNFALAFASGDMDYSILHTYNNSVYVINNDGVVQKLESDTTNLEELSSTGASLLQVTSVPAEEQAQILQSAKASAITMVDVFNRYDANNTASHFELAVAQVISIYDDAVFIQTQDLRGNVSVLRLAAQSVQSQLDCLSPVSTSNPAPQAVATVDLPNGWSVTGDMGDSGSNLNVFGLPSAQASKNTAPGPVAAGAAQSSSDGVSQVPLPVITNPDGITAVNSGTVIINNPDGSGQQPLVITNPDAGNSATAVDSKPTNVVAADEGVKNNDASVPAATVAQTPDANKTPESSGLARILAVGFGILSGLLGLGWLRNRSKLNERIAQLETENYLRLDELATERYRLAEVLRKHNIDPDTHGLMWSDPNTKDKLVPKPVSADNSVAPVDSAKTDEIDMTEQQFNQYVALRSAVGSLMEDYNGTQKFVDANTTLTQTAGYGKGSENIGGPIAELKTAVEGLLPDHPNSAKVDSALKSLKDVGIEMVAPQSSVSGPNGPGVVAVTALTLAAGLGGVVLNDQAVAMPVATSLVAVNTSATPSEMVVGIDYGDGIVHKAVVEDAVVSKASSPYGVFIAGPMFDRLMRVHTRN